MLLTIPAFAVVTLIGISGSGKSTFAHRHFKNTEILSSDYFRGRICDDEDNQEVNAQAFEALFFIARKRLELRRLTVIDATNTQPEAREVVLQLAREYAAPPVAIVLNLDAAICRKQNAQRERQVPAEVISRQLQQLHSSLGNLVGEGFSFVYHLETPDEVAAATILRIPM